MIQGKARWAKITGAPGKAFNPGEFEWSIDVEVDDAAKATLIADGFADKIKVKDGVEFITFKRKSVKADGTPSAPIRVVAQDKTPWPDDKKIGNGSVINVKYAINEWTFGKKTGIKPSILAVQVWDLVEFEGGDDFPMGEGAPW